MTKPATKILLVEDNLGDAGLLRAAIADIGRDLFSFQLAHVDRLSSAVAALQGERFDVVLLDLSLPDSSGLQTVRGMRQADPAIPIVVMSGLSDEQVALEAMRMGAQDYLVKGQIDSGMIVRAINHAIERQRIETDLRQQRERIATLHEINLAITETLNLRAMTERLLERIHRILPEYAIAVRLVNRQTQAYEPFAAWNMDEADWLRSIPRVGQGLTKAIFEAKAPFAVEDAIHDPRTGHREFFQRHGFVSYLGCPLIVKDELIGIISFFSKVRRSFSADEIEFFTMLAGQAAVAIQNCRLYEEIRDTNGALAKALEIKSVLIGVMAHELKNPIQVILGNANLLSDGVFGDLTADQVARVRGIEASGLELAQLIESAIDMARLDGGKMRFTVTEVCVASLLDELRGEFEAVFERKGLGLAIMPPQAPAFLLTDRVKLKEILRNLIENARKYTSQGVVTIQVEGTGQGLEFVVSDTGRGIPAELLPKVFELFFQADDSHREYASAGLGLNIVKRLVAAMSGEITVTSEVGKGSTFRVKLPNTIAAPASAR